MNWKWSCRWNVMWYSAPRTLRLWNACMRWRRVAKCDANVIFIHRRPFGPAILGGLEFFVRFFLLLFVAHVDFCLVERPWLWCAKRAYDLRYVCCMMIFTLNYHRPHIACRRIRNVAHSTMDYHCIASIREKALYFGTLWPLWRQYVFVCVLVRCARYDGFRSGEITNENGWLFQSGWNWMNTQQIAVSRCTRIMVAWKTPGPFGYADRKWLYLIHSMFVYSGKKESTTSIKYYINFTWHWIASTCSHGWPKDSHTNKRWSLRSTHASTENDKSPLKLTDDTKLFIFVVFTRDRITQFPCLCVARSFYSTKHPKCFLLVYIFVCVCCGACRRVLQPTALPNQNHTQSATSAIEWQHFFVSVKLHDADDDD